VIGLAGTGVEDIGRGRDLDFAAVADDPIQPLAAVEHGGVGAVARF
jgi:hypothetical protein